MFNKPFPPITAKVRPITQVGRERQEIDDWPEAGQVPGGDRGDHESDRGLGASAAPLQSVGGHQSAVPRHLLVVEHVRPAGAGGHVHARDQQAEAGLSRRDGLEGDERVQGQEGAGALPGPDREAAGREEEAAGARGQDHAPAGAGEGLVVLVALRQAAQERDDHAVPAAVPVPPLHVHGPRCHLLCQVRAHHSQPEDGQLLHAAVLRPGEWALTRDFNKLDFWYFLE